MLTVHTQTPNPLDAAVGTVEWVGTSTRLYGVDSVGNVFVFKTPRSTPAHLGPRRPGRLRILAGRLLRGPVFS